MISFGREICSHLESAERREWLVTNGIGGFAMGNIAGTLNRRYHGLLIAALKPPVARTLLLAKLDEDVKYDGRQYPLFANRWADGTLESEGPRFLQRFHLQGTTPVWTFALGDALLEKRLWMEPGANSTYIRYHYLRGTGALEIYAKAVVNHRDYHQTTILNDWQPQIETLDDGLRATLFEGATPLTLRCNPGEVWPEFNWYEDYFLGEEEARGQNDVVEDHVHVGVLGATLQPGQTFTILATAGDAAGPLTPVDGESAWQRRADHERDLLVQAARLRPPAPAQLVLAADQFVAYRAVPSNPQGATIIAGYPWFSDWGRDTMISLPGLALHTGRNDLAANILRTYSHFVDQGMIPNRFPDEGQAPEYNTVDASLWYIEAVRAYWRHAPHDARLPGDLYPVLQEIIHGYEHGTRYNIGVDSADGLVYAGEEGWQLTWMDAKVDDDVITPRIGKPIEINALWYNALQTMVELSQALGRDDAPYRKLAAQARQGFTRFWNESRGYCYDLLDAPIGTAPADDADADAAATVQEALRPNQIFAVSLPHSPLPAWQQKLVVDVCARRLLTGYGLRSLAPEEEGYKGDYLGDQRQRDNAYHQGAVWAWLMGPFVRAHLRVYGDRRAARNYLQPLMQHLVDHGVGSVSEIFEGDAPFAPRGCPAQAWSVAELIRAWRETA